MIAYRLLSFLLLAVVASAQEPVVTVLASIDFERIATAGLKKEVKSDMPDFTITYLHTPGTKDVIGIYDGAHPSEFSARGRKLGEVKDTMAGQSIVWTCWSQEKDGSIQYGAEAFLQNRKTVVTLPNGKKEEFVDQFHVFILRSDLKALTAARTLAAGIIRKGPNQMPEPTPDGVAHR